MGSYSHARSVHKTLSGTDVDSVVISGSWSHWRITNRAGAETLWLSVKEPGVVTAAPEADGSYFVIAGDSIYIPAPPSKTAFVVGDGNDYSVEGVKDPPQYIVIVR